MKKIKRGHIYLARLEGTGSQQCGIRPVLICSNNINNVYAPIINVLPITSDKRDLCVHVSIKKDVCGLERDSVILAEQITTINKTQLLKKIGEISACDLERVDKAVDIQLGRNRNNPFSEGVA